MKIALLHCSFIYTGGGERIVLEQIYHLKKNGHDVVCYAPVLDKTKCFPDILDSYNIRTFLPQLPSWVPFRFGLLLLLTCIFAPFFFYKFRSVDLFLGENQPGIWLAFVLSKILRKPYVAYLNHPNRMLYPRPNEDWASVKDFKYLSLLFKWVRPLLSYLDRVSVLAAKDRLVNGVFIGKEIENIYHCSWMSCPSGTFYIDHYLDRTQNRYIREKNTPVFELPSDWYVTNRLAYYNNPHTFEKLPEQEYSSKFLQVNSFIIDKPFVLYTGRHQPWKRIDWLVEIHALVLKKLQKKELYLVIPGPFTDHTLELQKLAQKLGVLDSVLFLGEIGQQDLHRLYRNATVYAFPSEREDFGIVVIEAMGYGLPVVAWNVGGPTDTVVDGKTGYLVKPYDKNAYANAILILVQNPELREFFGRSGIDRVKSSFSWERHVRILESAVEKAVQSPVLV
jgi:glycosyltransferase involved in cell wall biosynthesis